MEPSYILQEPQCQSSATSGRVSPASSDSLSTVSSLSSASGLQGRRMRPRTRHHGDNSHYNLFGDTVLGVQSTGTRRPLPVNTLSGDILDVRKREASLLTKQVPIVPRAIRGGRPPGGAHSPLW